LTPLVTTGWFPRARLVARRTSPQVHRLFSPFPPHPPTPFYDDGVDKVTHISTTRADGTPRSATSRRPSTNGGGAMRQRHSAGASSWPQRALRSVVSSARVAPPVTPLFDSTGLISETRRHQHPRSIDEHNGHAHNGRCDHADKADSQPPSKPISRSLVADELEAAERREQHETPRRENQERSSDRSGEGDRADVASPRNVVVSPPGRGVCEPRWLAGWPDSGPTCLGQDSQVQEDHPACQRDEGERRQHKLNHALISPVVAPDGRGSSRPPGWGVASCRSQDHARSRRNPTPGRLSCEAAKVTTDNGESDEGRPVGDQVPELPSSGRSGSALSYISPAEYNGGGAMPGQRSAGPPGSLPRTWPSR
jgi:hypothetical protein